MPYALTYSSTARFALDEREVSALLERAREINAAEQVTGLLVYARPSWEWAGFVQVLEGDRDAVERIFARIERDELHTGVVVLGRGPIAERDYDGWSMKFARMDHTRLPELLDEPAVGELNPLTDPEVARRVLAAADSDG
ncbi:BLUF domain-containing protein [Nocardia sp. NPDC003693]